MNGIGVIDIWQMVPVVVQCAGGDWCCNIPSFEERIRVGDGERWRWIIRLSDVTCHPWKIEFILTKYIHISCHLHSLYPSVCFGERKRNELRRYSRCRSYFDPGDERGKWFEVKRFAKIRIFLQFLLFFLSIATGRRSQSIHLINAFVVISLWFSSSDSIPPIPNLYVPTFCSISVWNLLLRDFFIFTSFFS